MGKKLEWNVKFWSEYWSLFIHLSSKQIANFESFCLDCQLNFFFIHAKILKNFAHRGRIFRFFACTLTMANRWPIAWLSPGAFLCIQFPCDANSKKMNKRKMSTIKVYECQAASDIKTVMECYVNICVSCVYAKMLLSSANKLNNVVLAFYRVVVRFVYIFFQFSNRLPRPLRFLFSNSHDFFSHYIMRLLQYCAANSI